LERYKKFKKIGKLSDKYANFNFAKNSVAISNEEMDRLLNLAAFWDKEYYTKVSWLDTVKNATDYYFWDITVANMQKLDPKNPENIRMIFWFDS
jgi:guanylate kinase